MKIARIVNSTSHINYVGRVVDRLDTENPPSAEDFGFGQFVSLPLDENQEFIGVIYDSQILNPDYAGFGPRLSPPSDLLNFSPDFLNEQGLLIWILVLGWRDLNSGANLHGIPRRVLPVNQEVYRLDPEIFCSFHRTKADDLQLTYYSQLLENAGAFAVPLLEAIIEQLLPTCGDGQQKQLKVLKQSLAWQRTLSSARL